ncbi:MAG: asparagine synthase (glutamine-hydrolyzing) [Gemmatimonadales bacterium]
MCGITGVVGLNGRPVDLRVLQRMNDVQAHRGPDGEGFVVSWPESHGFCSAFFRHTEQAHHTPPARVALGHRRLAILDLSDRGLQPMTAGASGAWIVFNGEIYNHLALRAELESRGRFFSTRTDTEVLLQSYLEWGEECLHRLDGMFAFAIWDGGRGRLFCARDRLGIKPFYYAMPQDHFIFASEIKGLLPFPELRALADDEAVLGFLIHGNCDYRERTIFRNVTALPAAHALTLDVTSRRLDRWCYWKPAPKPDWDHLPDGERIEELRELLVRTTRSHLISDVRAGSCLSGGLDSSAVVALIGKIWREQPEAATAVGDRFNTFTSCYEYPELDERRYALEVANAIGATPHLVFPSAADFWDVFGRMAWHQDMPFSGLSFYSQWRVMRAARETGVKVLLDGQGGDEVFGGYAKFRYAYLASLLRGGRLGTMAREAWASVLQRDLYILDLRRGYRYLPNRARRLLGVDGLLQRVLRADWDRAVGDESTPATRWWRHAAGRSGQDPAWTTMQSVQVEDILVDTLPFILRMEDRSSMAFSIEARVPLLDHRLVEYGLSLPDHLKIQGGFSKFAVRQATQNLMPEAVRLRRTKLGFAGADRRWLDGELRPQVTELIEGSLRCERFVDPAPLRQWYRSPGARSANAEAYGGLFRVLALEMWMRAFGVD